MASFHHRIKSGKKGTATEHAKYIARVGKHAAREDLIVSGYGNMPPWAKHDPLSFWRAGDKHERKNGAVYREQEIALPDELTQPQQVDLVRELIPELIGNKPYQFAIHSPISSLKGARNTHLHLMYSDRVQDGIERTPENTFRRYNPSNPDQGGCKKDSGGKNRMELRDALIETRRKSAELQNAALEKHGHATRVDHRTLRQQNILRTPEHRLGQAQIKHMSLEEKARFIADRQKD